MSEDGPEIKDKLPERALSIAEALGRAGPGEKAQARRMDADGAPVFWRQTAGWGLSPMEEAGWLRFTRAVALLTPASAEASIHEAKRPLGAVLAEAEFSEQRLARLLAARGEARAEALERAIRMLARSRPRLDVVDLARVILKRGKYNLARDYYAKTDHASTKDSPND